VSGDPATDVLVRFGLTPAQRSQIAAALALLASDPLAPTTVKDPAHAAAVHVADSLVALDLDEVREAGVIADLGSGAGFPGLALATALPDADVCLVEAQRRKCDFLERICSETGLANATVVCARAESWNEGMGSVDVVTARALAAQPVVLEYAAPLLRAGGSLVDWRGARSRSEENAADVAAAELGLSRREIRHVTPYDGARHHHLHVFIKTGTTPARFPRREGVARKRPLAS
jgi:16S rRNA (guanine527-N7)-methyltransferase